MADVFVSYAREDWDFARRLRDALQARGRNTWVDWEGIEPSDDWRQSIREAIDDSDAVLFVLSPDSLASRPCLDELDHASREHKRLIPVVHRDVEGLDVPPALEAANWLFLRDGDDFDAGVSEVERALDLDLELVRVHTRVLTRAKAWDLGGRRPTPLLRGDELRAAQRWLDRAAAGAEPKPTDLQSEFIKESRHRATRRMQVAVVGSLAVAVLAAVLAALALISRAQARHQARISLSRELAARSEAELATNPEDSITLAAQAVRVEQTSQAIHALSHALVASRLRADLRQPRLVTAVAFSPDSAALATGADDGVVRLWRLSDRRVLWSEGRGESPATSISFARAGDVLVVAHSSSTTATGCSADVLSASTGVVQRILEAARSGYCELFVGFAGSSRTVAVGDGSGAVRLFDVDDGLQIGTVDGLAPPKATGLSFVAAMSVSADGRAIAAVGGDKVVRAVTLPGGRPIGQVRSSVPIFNPDSVAFGPTDHQLLVGAEYNTEIDNLQDHSHLYLESVASSAFVAWGPDGRLAAATMGGAIDLWSAFSARAIGVLRGSTTQPASAIAFSASGMLATGSQDGSVRVWDPDPDLPTGRVLAPGSLDYGGNAPDAHLAAVGNASGDVLVTTEDGRLSARLRPAGDGPFAVGATGVMAYTSHGTLDLVRLPNGRPVRSWKLPSSAAPADLATSADGRAAAIVTSDGTITSLSGRGTVTKHVAIDPSVGASISMSPDGRLLVVAGATAPSGVRVLRTLDLQPVRNEPGSAASFSSSGKLLAIERPDLTIAVLRTDTWHVEAVLRGETFGGAKIAFSPDDELLSVMDDDGILRAWDVSDGTVLGTRYVVEGLYPGRTATPPLVMTSAGLALVGGDPAGTLDAFDICSTCLKPAALLSQAESRLRAIKAVSAS